MVQQYPQGREKAQWPMKKKINEVRKKAAKKDFSPEVVISLLVMLFILVVLVTAFNVALAIILPIVPILLVIWAIWYFFFAK